MERGQAGLILIMIMAVIGTVSVGVASRSVENLRGQEVETASSQAFRAAEAGLELALSQRGDVSGSTGTGSYSTTYTSTGSDGFVADSVVEGDVVQISLAGATGVTGLSILWNSTSAVKVSLLNGDTAAGNYSVKYYTYDPNAGRTVSNKFSAAAAGETFKGVTFGSGATINLETVPPTQLVRILVLYGSSSVGIRPIGGTLASQGVEIKSTGTVEGNIVSKLSFSLNSPERVPAIFDNVLYTNSSLTQ